MKTQENVDDWDSVMRNQQLVEHDSTLKKLSMIVLRVHTTAQYRQFQVQALARLPVTFLHLLLMEAEVENVGQQLLSGRVLRSYEVDLELLSPFRLEAPDFRTFAMYTQPLCNEVAGASSGASLHAARTVHCWYI